MAKEPTDINGHRIRVGDEVILRDQLSLSKSKSWIGLKGSVQKIRDADERTLRRTNILIQPSPGQTRPDGVTTSFWWKDRSVEIISSPTPTSEELEEAIQSIREAIHD